jgi:hypothetical protein
VEVLEARLKPSEPESPILDVDLLTESEKEYVSLVMTVLRAKARELGYGDKNNRISWFDLRRCDPVFDENIRAECLAAMSVEEARVVETLNRIIEKGHRLTAVLSDEEKADVKRYNYVVSFFRNPGACGSGLDAHGREDLVAARRRYEETMVRHGEAVYEKPIGSEAS